MLPATSVPTATPPATATPLPPATPTPTSEPTATPVAQVDRSCPTTVPPRPDYATYVTSEAPWPVALTSETARPYLAYPLETNEEMRVNWGYPYGSDGSGRYSLHNGLDMTLWPGAPVLAVADGTVIYAGSDAAERYGPRCDWYGQLVVLELDQRWQGEPLYALYGHVRGILVEMGQRVAAGEPLAEVGAGGVATVPHLHLELRVGENEYGATRNPVLWLDPGPEQGVVAGRLVDAEGHAWEGVRMTLIDLDGELDFLTTWTYLSDPLGLINPDERLAENFVFGGVPPGEYDLYAALDGREYRQRVSVAAGEIAVVELVTEPPDTSGRDTAPEP